MRFMRLPPDSPIRAEFSATYGAAVDLLVASGNLAQSAAPLELAEQGVGTWGTDPVDFAAQWADHTETTAVLEWDRIRPPVTGLQRRTIRSAAHICLGDVVQRACDLVSDYEPKAPQGSPKRRGLKIVRLYEGPSDRPLDLERDPLTWRTVMDQLSPCMDVYRDAGIIGDRPKRPLASRGHSADIVEMFTTTPHARRVQKAALHAITLYAQRKHSRDEWGREYPLSPVLAGVMGEIALAQSYGSLDDPAAEVTSKMLLRMRRLDAAIRGAHNAGASFNGIIVPQLSPDAREWIVYVRNRHSRIVEQARRSLRKPLSASRV